MNNGSFDSNAVGTPAVAAIGLNGADGIDVSSLGDGGVAVFAIANGPCAVYAEGLNGGPGVFGYSDTGTGVVAAAMQGVGLQAFGGGTLDFGEIPPPQLPPMPPPAFPQAGIAAVGSPGVCGSGTTDAGGVFESDRGAQLRLVPSATPIEDTSLYETGKVGDLYLWSLNGGQGETSPGKGGAYLYETILWLCMAPAQPDGSAPAYWIQLANTSTF